VASARSAWTISRRGASPESNLVCDVEIGATDIVTNQRNDAGELRVSDRDGRFADGDALVAFATQFERQCEAEGLLRQFFLDFDAQFRIEPLLGDEQAGAVDRAGQARGGNGGVVRHCALDRCLHGQSRRCWRLLGGCGGRHQCRDGQRGTDGADVKARPGDESRNGPPGCRESSARAHEPSMICDPCAEKDELTVNAPFDRTDA